MKCWRFGHTGGYEVIYTLRYGDYVNFRVTFYFGVCDSRTETLGTTKYVEDRVCSRITLGSGVCDGTYYKWGDFTKSACFFNEFDFYRHFEI